MAVDERILRSACTLKTIRLRQDGSRLGYLFSILGMCFSLLAKPTFRTVLVWFADYHAAPAALLCRLLGKRCFILIGGYDAVRYPELGMGVYCTPLRAFCARLALRNCTGIIANHEALLSSDNLYYNPAGHPEGVFRLVPGLKTPASVVHNATTTETAPSFTSERQPKILTVGTTPRLQDFYNKGYDLLIEVARRRPDLNFIFVGLRREWLAELDARHSFSRLPNLEIIPWLAQAELLQLMGDCAVYAQPSISEGMPNALMEAMLMGCVPVGSQVSGIPTVIGELGFLITRRDSTELEQALDQALAAAPDRQMISNSVRERFSLQQRKQKLLAALEM